MTFNLCPLYREGEVTSSGEVTSLLSLVFLRLEPAASCCLHGVVLMNSEALSVKMAEKNRVLVFDLRHGGID